jgi:hypothetical protein
MRGMLRSVGLLALLTIAAIPSDCAQAAIYLPGSQAAPGGFVTLAQSRRGPRGTFQPPPPRSLQRVPAGAADRLRSLGTSRLIRRELALKRFSNDPRREERRSALREYCRKKPDKPPCG